MPNSITLLMIVLVVVGLWKANVSPSGISWSRKEKAQWERDRELLLYDAPIRCNIPSPDGVLVCSKEICHSGWHSHHGPVSWFLGNWAEDDHYERRGNIPW